MNMTRRTRRISEKVPAQSQLFKLIVLLTLWMLIVIKLFYDGFLSHTTTIKAVNTNITSGLVGFNWDTNINTTSNDTNLQDLTRTWRPVDPTRKLLILSYQRCGSSFFGDIFGKHPDVMYMYEPLDGFYTHLYGTKEGWNVPSDITNYPNGTERFPPRREVWGVTKVLDDILNCNIDKVPTTILYNKFWELFARHHSSISDFIHCYKNNSLNKAETCRRNILCPICPDRFDASNKLMETCQRELNSVHRRGYCRMPVFKKYIQCLNMIRANATSCDDKLETICHHKQFRTVKTVRATMDSMEDLMLRNPNLRIIHLFRDPRPVMVSRKKFKESSYGLYSTLLSEEKLDLAKEARLYCSTVMRDIHKRKELEKKYPNKIIEVIYDQFVLDLINNTKQIYNFIDIPFPKSLQEWLIDNSHGRIESNKNAMHIASKWQSTLSFKDAKDISVHCEELFQTVTYQWPR